jgi:hypothetical protein
MTTDPNIDAVKDALDQIAAKDAAEAALIADLSGQLETTIETLRGTLEDLAAMTAERDAIAEKLRKLEDDKKPPVKAFEPSMLRAVGGYRLPECFVQAQKKTLAFSHGGITGRNEPDGLRIWVTHHATSMALAELTAPATRGSIDAISQRLNLRHHWPIATFVRNIEAVYAELYAIDNACQIHGVHWDAEGNRLLASGRSWYSTTGGKDAWIVPVDVDQDPPARGPRITPGLSMQVFGGGFANIPEWFANQYCGGNTIGLGLGGYESGQGSSHSPSLAAWGSEPNKVLMQTTWLAPKEEQEQRDNAYNSGNVGWQPQPDGEVGYWGTARCQDICWLDTPSVSAFLAISLQPLGTLVYSNQGDVFTNNNVQYVLYVYDPADLAEVATGELAPHQLRGRRYPFPTAIGKPKGMWWDNERQLLSVFYANGWTWGGSESYPVVIEYEVANG